MYFHGVCSCSTAFRAQQGEVVRSACRIVPLEAFQIAAEWLQYQITSPIDTGDTTCKCSFSSWHIVTELTCMHGQDAAN